MVQNNWRICFLQHLYKVSCKIYVWKSLLSFQVSSEWMIIVKSQMTIFKLYQGENKLHSMKWWCLLCTQTNMLKWIFIVLAHWNKSLRVDMSFHSNTLPWLRENQSLFLLLKRRSSKYQFYSLWLDLSGGLPQDPQKHDGSMLTITSPMLFSSLNALGRKCRQSTWNKFFWKFIAV